ncbi:NAD(P)H-dependent oxidoreductase [Candidatus Saccharibacteria bacterium]|jgi:NAD(P)H-dependent FMN reductase|nr:NAD(P)H-dependent oxidoreductase [Candidatus Saccharibacteria bacterium]MCA9313093.1 NAD(P)H-dependent oxidoreductase [Candidatus Saccharibacteria bacterium]
MNLLIVTTSVRKGRSGEKVTNWFVDQVEKDGRFTPDVVDLKELNLSYELPEKLAGSVQNSEYDNEEDVKWAKHVNKADAVVFVMPEYNHGYPASIKNAVDHLYHEWNGKPVSFVGYGSAGAPYAIGSFADVAYWTKMDIVNAHVGISEIWAAFDEDGKLRHQDYHAYEAKTMLDSLTHKVEAKKN